jgi:hypothetical protein
METSRGFRIFISIITSLVICFAWMALIIWHANRSGGDDGSDPFGGGHIVLLLVSSPFVLFFFAKFMYQELSGKK